MGYTFAGAVRIRGVSFQGMGDLSVRCFPRKKKGAEAPPAHDESHRLSLGELRSRSARFRFTGCFQCRGRRFGVKTERVLQRL